MPSASPPTAEPLTREAVDELERGIREYGPAGKSLVIGTRDILALIATARRAEHTDAVIADYDARLLRKDRERDALAERVRVLEAVLGVTLAGYTATRQALSPGAPEDGVEQRARAALTGAPS